MKATVREYTVKKRVVVIELTEEEASQIANDEIATFLVAARVRAAIRDALEADRASNAQEDEDVPY